MYYDPRDKYIPRKYVRCPSLFKLSMFASEKQVSPTVYDWLRLGEEKKRKKKKKKIEAFTVRSRPTILSGQMLYL